MWWRNATNQYESNIVIIMSSKCEKNTLPKVLPSSTTAPCRLRSCNKVLRHSWCCASDTSLLPSRKIPWSFSSKEHKRVRKQVFNNLMLLNQYCKQINIQHLRYFQKLIWQRRWHECRIRSVWPSKCNLASANSIMFEHKLNWLVHETLRSIGEISNV